MHSREPETDARAYKAWAEHDWHDYIIEELEILLLFVRKLPISGLAVGEIRGATFVPFGGPDLFNRKAALLTKEIEAYNGKWKNPVDEEALIEEWQLSGLNRP